MKYIYILDYSFDHIYEIIISEEKFNSIKDIDIWLFKNYRFKYNNCDYMVSNKKLEIETINKL